MKSEDRKRVPSRDPGKESTFLSLRPGVRLTALFVFMGTGTVLSGVALWDLLLGQSSGREILILALAGAGSWLPGMILLPPLPRRAYAIVPFLLPLAGPPLMVMAALFFLFSRRKDYLADDPTIEMIFSPPKGREKRVRYSLADILAHDRKIVSAGDILRWGDVSLKQALIDRLASRQITPRAIRILRGARNDADDEVRLFASTILTRIEKRFQETTAALLEKPDAVAPHATLGRAYLEYAESGLVGDRLALSLYSSSMASYEKALAAGEALSRDELLHLANVAVAQKNLGVFVRARERLRSDCDPLDLKRLEWVSLYESGNLRGLREEILASRSLWGAKELPPYLSVWIDAAPAREFS